MVGTLVSQLTKGVSPEILKREGLGEYYTDHGISVYPSSAAGVPFTAAYIGVKGDPVTDLYEDLVAEQKARSTYEYLIDLSDDPDVTNVLKFLREREIVHFQRFGEALRTVQEKLAQRKFYMNNDCGCMNVLGASNKCGGEKIMDRNDRKNDCGCGNMMCNDDKKNDCGCGNVMGTADRNNDCGCKK